MAHRILYRSDTDMIIAGVIGGIAEYFDTDATLLRIIWLFFVVFTGGAPGIIIYIVAALIMPHRRTIE